MQSDHQVDAYRIAIPILDTSTLKIKRYLEASEKFRSTQDQHHLQKENSNTVVSNPEKQVKAKLINSSKTNLNDGLRAASDNLQRSIALALITTDDTISRHDYMLAQIDSEAGTTNEDFDDGKGSEYSGDLLAALQHTQAETIRTRLKRKYLESLASHSARSVDQTLDNNAHGSSQAKTDLVKTDLRTLHSEIDDVAQLLVMHEYGDQINEVNEKLSFSKRALQARQTQQATAQIAGMTKQLETIAEHLETLQSHRVLQQKVQGYLEAIKLTEKSQRPASPQSLYAQPVKRGTASLVALRQYLGLDRGLANRTERSRHLDSIFETLVGQVDQILAIQAEQSKHLHATQESETNLETSNRHPHHSILNELDHDIADIKARLEQLPNKLSQ